MYTARVDMHSRTHLPSLSQVYACVGSWVQLGNFPCEELAQSSLITAPFQTLVGLFYIHSVMSSS